MRADAAEEPYTHTHTHTHTHNTRACARESFQKKKSGDSELRKSVIRRSNKDLTLRSRNKKPESPMES